MVPTSARLLRLLALLQARPEWAGHELAARLGVTVRTLRRDIQRLRELDYPVHSTPGVAGGYRLGSGAVLPPLLLDDDEAIAVVLSLRSAAPHTVAGLAEASVRALAKLDQVLPARLRERTSALQHAMVPLAGPEPTVDAKLLTLLAAACRRCLRLTFEYRDHAGASTTRTAEPHRLVSTGYRWYLVAFDSGADDWRTFRVDRISRAEASRGRFAPRKAPDAAAFVAAQVSTAPYRYRARVLVRASASALAELVAPTVGVIEDLGKGECVLSTGSDSLDALAFHLAALGAEFEVQEPPELVEHMRLLADRLARAVSPGVRVPAEE
jgi:predicted DNA-binding transcriptional regulator YafY